MPIAYELRDRFRGVRNIAALLIPTAASMVAVVAMYSAMALGIFEDGFHFLRSRFVLFLIVIPAMASVLESTGCIGREWASGMIRGRLLMGIGSRNYIIAKILSQAVWQALVFAIVLAPLVFCAFDLGLSSTRLEDAVLDGGEIAYRVAIFLCVSFLTQELVSGFTLLITVLLDGRQLAACAVVVSSALAVVVLFGKTFATGVGALMVDGFPSEASRTAALLACVTIGSAAVCAYVATVLVFVWKDKRG